jgi:hypothetical protein
MTVEFICKFEMQYYPFDKQKCLAYIVMKGNSGYFVNLIEENVTYTGPSDMKQYLIAGVRFVDNKHVSKTTPKL